jgi:methylaspartate mutase epsilon subunit
VTIANRSRDAAPGRLTDEAFEAERADVLGSWATGAEIDVDEAVAYHETLPEAKDFARTIATAYEEGRTIAFPRTGKALLREHIDDLMVLWENGAELHGTHADAYTRTQRYAAAGAALEESEAEGRSLLNGLPVLNLGY